MSEISNSPKVSVRYVCVESSGGGFDLDFNVSWSHRDGHEKFQKELFSLIDGLHMLQAARRGRSNHE